MMRERSTGSYRVGPYFLAKSTSDMGLYTVAPLLYATIVYWSVGLRAEAGAFFIFLLIFMLEVYNHVGMKNKCWMKALRGKGIRAPFITATRATQSA